MTRDGDMSGLYLSLSVHFLEVLTPLQITEWFELEGTFWRSPSPTPLQ